MNFPLFVALRYFRSRKSTHVINIISIISMVGVGVGTAALIIVLSVFNGFESLVVSLYNSFDPHIRVTAVQGKNFNYDESLAQKIREIPGVQSLAFSLEDNALLKYGDKQYICTVKGVSPEFFKAGNFNDHLIEGKNFPDSGSINYAIAGQGVAYFLSLNMNDVFRSLQLYVPAKNANISLNPEDAFVQRNAMLSGVFSIQQDFDAKYVLVPLPFAEELFSAPNRLSALEITLGDESRLEEIRASVSALTGPGFKAETRYEQHAMLYKIMKSEKWAVYLILTFILLIATFNIIGSLTMLILDKKKDIALLNAMGAGPELIKKIFLLEGMLISTAGTVFGMFFGFAVCLFQQFTGLIKLQGSGTFVIDAYPVAMKGSDFLYVFLTVMVIGFLAAWIPAGRLTSRLGALRIE